LGFHCAGFEAAAARTTRAAATAGWCGSRNHTCSGRGLGRRGLGLLFRFFFWCRGWCWRRRCREFFGDYRWWSWGGRGSRWASRLCFEPLVRRPKLLIKSLELFSAGCPALLLHATLLLFSPAPGPLHSQGDLR